MELKKIKISEIKEAGYNPRKISKEELKRLKESIEKFGYVEPVIINEKTGRLVGGHQRVKALKELGREEIEYIPVNLMPDEEKALNLALNRITGEWDNQKLIEVLKQIQDSSEDLLPNTGFSDQEILYLLELEKKDREKINALEDDVVLGEEVKVRGGDIISLGNHKIICGDSTDPKVWRALLGEEKIDLIVTSPPYNLDIKYSKYKDKKEVWEYMKFLSKVFDNAKDYMNKGRYLCVNIGREWGPLNMPAKYDIILEELGFVFFRNIYWLKPLGSARVGSIRNPFPRYYKPKVQTEKIIIYSNDLIPDADHMIKYVYGQEFNKGEKRPQKEPIPDIMIQKYAGNVWEMHTETQLHREHPAPFPVQLPFNCIRFYTFENEIVMDPFGGASTTMIAAEQLNRKARIIELDPSYVQASINRFKKLFPGKAVKCLNRKVEL